MTYASSIEIPTAPHSIDEDDDRQKFVANKSAFAKHHLLWLSLLQQIEDGKLKRLMGFMPPGSAKSVYTSVVFPTHFLGRFPRSSIIVASYGSDLPRKFGRRARSIVTQPVYRRIFDASLSEESAAVDEWALSNGSEWMAKGILTGITGNRFDGIIWDDLIKGREEADSKLMRDKTWDAYMDDLQTRRKPHTFEIGVMCMTGDTKVTMADGNYKLLKDVRAGDEVLSWINGQAAAKQVLDWRTQGEDDIFEVRTGGSKVKANGRHPFLVQRDNNHEWVRLKDLKIGDELVTLSRIPGRQKAVLNKAQAWLLGYMFGDGWITTRDTVQRGYKGHVYPRRGYVTSVALSADPEENERVAVAFETVFRVRPKQTKYHCLKSEKAAMGRWFIDAGLHGNAKTKRLPNYIFDEPEDVRLAFLEGFNCADGHTVPEGRKGAGSWALTSCNVDLLEDIRQLARGVGYKVTNIYVKDNWYQAPCSPKPTFSRLCRLNFRPNRVEEDFFSRRITSIKPVGREEVFDIQVEGSECFIADGVVSHNTRWHEDDPAGRLLPADYDGSTGLIKCQDGNDWYVVCLPAECERNDDPLGRKPGDILWPEWFSKEHFAPFKRYARSWSALYQQRPAPDTGDYFQAEWLRPYSRPADPAGPINQPLRETMTVYGASDYAVTADGGDYTVHVIVGIDNRQRMFLLDLWRGQTSSDKWVEAMGDLIHKWRPVGWAEETGQIKSGVGPWLIKHLRSRQLYVVRQQFPARHDKATRARSIQGRMSMDGLYVPIHAPWYPALRHELLTFPAGKHDDICDALGLIGQVLDKMIPGHALAAKDEAPKIISTDPAQCTVTLKDLFDVNEGRGKYHSRRIH